MKAGAAGAQAGTQAGAQAGARAGTRAGAQAGTRAGARAPRSVSNNGSEKFLLFDKAVLGGIFLSLAGIYAAALLPTATLLPDTTFAFLAGFGMVFAVVWASGAIRKISKYGLGTGVPSVGMFGIGIGCIVSLYSLSLNSVWGPVAGTVLALLIGLISGKLINKVLQMNIPSMEKRMAEMAAGSTLAITASAVVAGGTFNTIFILHDYVGIGIVAIGFIGCSLAIFHAYNSNLGPDEAPDRTRALAVLDSFLVMFVLGIASFLTGEVVGPIVTIFISIVFILISYYRYWTYIQRDAWKIMSTGLLPGEEDLN